MAEGSVCFLLRKLSELIEGDAQLVRRAQADVEHIVDELEFMRSFLRVADAIEDNDTMLKIIVKKVRTVAYAMDDAIEDFRLSLARGPGHGSGEFPAFTKLTFALKTLRARRRLASQLRSIRTRVEILGDQQRSYSDQNTGLMRLGPSLTKARHGRRAVAVPVNADLVGMEDHKNKLIVQLLGDKAARYVVSVVGMGGLGKSTLASMVYNDTEIKNQFKFRAWITVSQSYKIEDLLRKFIQQICEVLKRAEPKDLDYMANEQLRTEIGHLLKQRRYLVVLDDVWDTGIWDEFKEVLPNDNTRSRVLFTTRIKTIAFHSCQGAHENVYSLTPLSAEDSWKLFERKLFKNGPCPTNLREVTEKFLRKCEGLPLAIVAIAGVLSSKNVGRLDAWEMVDNSLGDAPEDNDGLERLKNILSLSYNDLPFYLKSCLLYLSIFPLGNTIERMRIIRLWVAEGFVVEREGMTLEEVAGSYLNELIKRNLVKVVEMTNDGRVKTCRIHDILREIMISKAKDQVFAAIVKDQDKRWPEKVRCLSIHDARASIQQRQIGYNSRLRSLLMFWGMDHSPESNALKLPLQRLNFLHVLHLEGAPLKEFPKQIVDLVLLKYLSLRGTKVDSIPSSIDKLQNIETLDMKHTLVTKLPDQILKLQKLQHLLVYRYIYMDFQVHNKFGFKSPIQIGKLQSIQKLCFLEADQGEELLVEIGKLSQLRRLGIVKLRGADGDVLCSSICKLMNLQALSVTAASEHELINMDYMPSPPPFLQRVYLTGRLEKLPDWISSLHNLVKLVLKWSKLSVKDDPLAPLHDLPHLVHLAFVQAYDGEVLRFTANGFKKLKFLGLNRLERLNSIVLEEGAVACLENLVVHSCSCLHKLPQGIEHLAKLKELEFVDMPQELAESLRNLKGIDHVQTIHFVDKNDGYLNKYDFKS